MSKKSVRFEISGLVQGVGFRPFVYRIAARNGITGWVMNTNEGVTALVQGNGKAISAFRQSLLLELPAAARIDSVSEHPEVLRELKTFTIRTSRSVSEDVTDIAPDIAVCSDCLDDMQHQVNRLQYPFINCTHCGPRFSIIRSVPYDRKNTTMARFEMCGMCRKEYSDLSDRRFHAQPVACNHCGPVYELVLPGRRTTVFKEVLDEAASRISRGQIAAVKGIGGFQLVCDAFNSKAVARLRKKKFREGKPFALMARDIKAIRKHCLCNSAEETALISWRRPIVLLMARNGNKQTQLPPGINPGLSSLGFILPYMPLHYQLFEKLSTDIIVFTSGNLSDEPIITDNSYALTGLASVADFTISHDRDIHNRCDDSVMLVASGLDHVIRRSRGYVPGFIRLPFHADGILALGAEMANCFCIGKGTKAIQSQHMGDLKNAAARDFFTSNIDRFSHLFRFVPEIVVHDLHPDYFSTVHAAALKKKFSRRGKPVITLGIQHHHAHIASAMAEFGLDEKVIGVCFDGTGYGTDGNAWGGEFLLCDAGGFERYSHFEYIPLPGGDKAVEEPWRTALSFLLKVYGKQALSLPLVINQRIPAQQRGFIADMILKGVNTPLSSGAGRLFDAVSALLGLCMVSRYEAEAPMRLESIIKKGCRAQYNVPAGDPIATSSLVREIAEDIMRGGDPGLVSAKFHNTIISLIFERAMEMARRTGIRKVVLSGGVFQNRYILEGVKKKFGVGTAELFVSSGSPSNDGGIALGQLYIAAKKMQKHVSRSSGKGRQH
jgi:hydrogenase maturation protein HypF